MDELLAERSVDRSSSRPGSSKLKSIGEDTEAGDDDEDPDIFDAFKFTSFRTQNLIEEKYEMVHLKDPEEPEEIEVNKAFPKEKVEKELVEIVAISQDELLK